MKNNTLFHITSGSKIPIFLRILKQAIFSLRLRSILAGLLVMTLTISIEGVELGDSAGGRSAYSPDLSVDLSVGPSSDSGSGSVSDSFIGSGCAMEMRYDLEGVPWRYLFSDGPPPEGEGNWTGAAISILTGVISPKKFEEYRSDYESTDTPAARFRMLSGSYLALYGDADKPLATVSTSYFNAHTLRSFWTGQYFAGARPLGLDLEFKNYISDNPPREYIGLQQTLFGEGLWKDNSKQYFGGLGYNFLSNRLNQGSYRFFIDAGTLEAGSQAETAEDDAWQWGIGPALIQKLAEGRAKWGEGMTAAGPPKFDRPPKLAESMSAIPRDRFYFASEAFEAGGDRLQTQIAFVEDNPWLWYQGTDQVVPNDPLFAKEESQVKKAASGLAKGLGSIFNLGGSTGITVGESPGESTKPPNQWGLLKVGFTPRSNSQSAWNIEDGSRKNVVVAVIDSGLDLTHVDGPEFLWTNSGEIPDNDIDDDANGYVDDIHGWNFAGENNDITDYYGHGTFVTGIIAAKTNNGEGIAGINPGAQIMTLKAGSKSGKPHSLAIYRAIRYAVDNGARVINISLGGKGISRLQQIAVNYAYAQGCLVVISSGNQGGDVAEYSPPGLRRAFSVAAIDVDGKRRGSANSGANVAMTAPGEHIYSLTAKEGKRDGQITPILGTQYHTLTGTSFSAPMVAGTASLIWAKYPHLTNRQVEDRLLNSAMYLGQAGWDRYNGAGLLNAGKALGGAGDDQLTVRFTEVFANKEKKKIASLDVYGIVRGNLDSYVVELGKGKKPDKWKQACGPSAESAEYNHICRIENELLKKGREWTVRITAQSKSGEIQTASYLVKKKQK